MIPESLDLITAQHLRGLVESGTEEGPTLEFKRDLPGDDRDSRKEFIADVCALTNSKGGDIVFGLDEGPDGRAGEFRPSVFNPDETITRLTNVLNDGLEPRLHGVGMRAIDIDERGKVLVVRVPRSFAGIHRSARDGHFWVRESRSKRQLDVPGITNRVADLLGRQDRVADLFARRYAASGSGLFPLALDPGPKVVLHIVPTRDLFSGEEIDLTDLSVPGRFWVMSGARSSDATHVYEGILHHPPVTSPSDSVRAATLIFRSGLVEAIATVTPVQLPNGGPEVLPLEKVEKLIVSFLQAALRGSAERLAGGWPVTVRTALLGHQDLLGRTINRDLVWDRDNIPPVRVHSAVLQLPDILFEQQPASIPLAMRPVFNRLWQSWGYPSSLSYQNQGGGVLWQGNLT